MGNLGNSHGYDILYKESLVYYREDEVKKNSELNAIQKARIGFYYLVFELLFGETQRYDVNSYIIDDDFSDQVKGTTNKDLGIDAVYVDETEKTIYLLNFKFRGKFQRSSNKPKYDEVRSAETFLNNLMHKEEFEKLKSRNDVEQYRKTINKIEKLKNLNDEDNYRIVLYMVTNDNSTVHNDDPGIQAFAKQFEWLEIRDYNLANIQKELEIHSPDNEAVLELDNRLVLEHNIAYTSTKSYIIELDLTHILRITNTNEALRKAPRLEEGSDLMTMELDFDILFDNVRDYLPNSKINKKIAKTLSKESQNFFLYNNGLTITAETITAEAVKFNNSTRLTLKNYQVVNGGQTLRSIYLYKNNTKEDIDTVLKNLVNSSVLVRLLATNTDEELTSKISEYTNSQNPIKELDLRSVDRIQRVIEKRLDQENIHYQRKRGRGRTTKRNYVYSISMEKLGQILFAFEGKPESAGNSKSQIFSDSYYPILFNEEPKLLETIIEQIKIYDKVGLEYSKTSYDYYDQKAYYILYLYRCFPKKDILYCIDFLEENLKNYVTDKETTEAKKLLQAKFKHQLNESIQDSGGKISGKLVKKNNKSVREGKKAQKSFSQSKTTKKINHKKIEDKVVYTEEDHKQNKSDKSIEYYTILKGKLLEQVPNIVVEPKKQYIAFKNNNSNVVDIEIQKRQLKLTINAKKGTIEDPKKVFTDVSSKGHWGNGDYQVVIKDDSNFDYILEIIKQSISLR